MANKLNDRMKSIFATTRSRVIFIVVAVIVAGRNSYRRISGLSEL